MMTIALTEQIAEVKREIAMRKRVYPRRIADARMTQEQADRQIAAMEAVLATLQSVTKPSPQQQLFDAGGA